MNPVQTPGLSTVPRLTFTHNGIARTLNKHPAVQLALRRGELSLADAKHKSWYLRAKIAGAERSFQLSPLDKDALRRAKDILNGSVEQPEAFADFLAQRAARHGVTLGTLAQDWRAAGYPDENGRARKPASASRAAHELDTALKFWTDKRAATAADHFNDFIAWRRSAVKKSKATALKRFTGDRAADLDLNVLSCLCSWAVFARKLEKNPFADRPTYHDPNAVVHCSDLMPESDEVVHRILTWFFSGGGASVPASRSRIIIAGAWLAWCNLTGLRPSEPYYLQRSAPLLEPPHRPDTLAPGTIFPLRRATLSERAVLCMRVHRRKHGQNPYITLHPVAEQFLTLWSAWLDAHLSTNNPQLFPGVCHLTTQKGVSTPDTAALSDLLAQACAAVKVPLCTPAGFGRAYYTRVRKSQGASNAVIAEELGQTTLGKLIRQVYGSASDQYAAHRYDWLPEADGKPTDPAWNHLQQTTLSNIIAL
jgi:hypothetical protein